MTTAAESIEQKIKAVKLARKGLSREEIGMRLGKATAWVSSTMHRDPEFADSINDAEAAFERLGTADWVPLQDPVIRPVTWQLSDSAASMGPVSVGYVSVGNPTPPTDTGNTLHSFRAYLAARHHQLLEATAVAANQLADLHAELNAVIAALTSLDETPHLVRALRIDDASPKKKVARR